MKMLCNSLQNWIRKVIYIIFSLSVCSILCWILWRFKVINVLDAYHTFILHRTRAPFNPVSWKIYLQGENILLFWYIFVIILIFSWFAGIILMNLLVPRIFTSEEKITFAWPIGFLSLCSIWTTILLYTGYFNGNLYIILTIILLIIGSIFILINKKIALNKKEQLTIWKIIIATIVLIYCFMAMSNIFKNNFVPHSWDCMTTSYLEALIKSGKTYPVAQPYLDASSIIINYPPAYDVMVCVLASVFYNTPLVTLQMIITICCTALVGFTIFLIVKKLTSRIFLGASASFISMTGTLVWITNGGGSTQENMTMLAAAVFILFLENIYSTEKYSNSSIFIEILTGIFLGISMLGHPRVFQYYFWAFVLFIFFLLVFHSQKKQIIKSTIFIFLGSVLISFPWILSILRKFKDVCYTTSTNIEWEPVLQITKELFSWHHPFLIYLSLLGILVAFFSKKKTNVFIGIYTVINILSIEYYRILEFLEPNWFEFLKNDKGIVTHFSTLYPLDYIADITQYGFTIVFPILAALSMGFIYDVGKKIKLPSVVLCVFVTVISFDVVVHNFFYVPPGAGMILSREDYNVLRKLNKNSSYENTFILNPWHMSPWSEGNWAGPVSERRTVFFRYNPGLALNWKLKTIDDEKAKWVFQNIDRPESYDLLKKWKVTHIFLPKSVSTDIKRRYAKTKYLVVEFEEGQDNNKTIIYRVIKNESKIGEKNKEGGERAIRESVELFF